MKHFNEILNTIGAAETYMLDDSGTWEFWKAIYRTPVQNIEGYYLYLKYKCRNREASEANVEHWRKLSNKSGYEVIVTPNSSLSQKLPHTKGDFNGNAIRTSKQLLLDIFLKGLCLKPFIVEEYFIDPDIELSNKKTEHNAAHFLIDWLTEPSSIRESLSLGILVADGGVGKTTLARVLCQMLHKENPTVYPILIESDQWRNILQSSITLESIIDLAISKRFDNAARLFSNKTALRVLINEGLFVVIFDGFDELCVHPNWAFYPKDVITGLSDYLNLEDGLGQAKILLTARRTYWDSISEGIDARKLDIFRLKGFDNEQRKRYFVARLQDPAERDAALRLSKQISGGIYEGLSREENNENRPSGVPFILDLIARYVKEDATVPISPYQADPLGSLLEDICRRENKRQALDIEPKKQLELFEELFREYPITVSIADLKVYLEIICGVQDPSVIQRFTNHVFLVKIEKDLFGPRYEVLRVYFLARFLAKGLSETIQKASRNTIARVLAANSSGKTQVLDWLLHQLKLFEEKKLILAIHHALQIINEEDDRDVQKASAMALSHIVMRLISDNDKTARLNRLRNYYKGTQQDEKVEFRRVLFTGQIRSIEFSETVFKQCCFIDVEFKNCNFSKKTAFQSCIFEGTLAFPSCEQASEITVNDPKYSKEAEFVLTEIRNDKPREEVRRDFAEDAMTRALKKFRGDWGFETIQKRHKSSGMKHGNPYNEVIWDKLISAGIVEDHLISGVTEGGLHIVEDKEIRREIVGYLDNGVAGKRLKQVIEDTMK